MAGAPKSTEPAANESDLYERYERLSSSFEEMAEESNRVIRDKNEQLEKMREAERERERLREQLNPPGTGRKIRMPNVEAFDRLKEEVGQIRTENERLRSEKSALETRIEREAAEPEDQLSDVDLKRRCLELADELYEFSEEHEIDDASRAEIEGVSDLMLEASRQEIWAMRQYERHLGGKVIALLDEVKQRGWLDPESLDSEERKSIQDPVHPLDVRRIAQRLSAIGHRR